MVELYAVGRHTVDDIPDDERRWELVDGVLTLSPSPLWGHSRAVSRLHDIVRGAVGPDHWVASDTGLAPEIFNYRVPDLLVIRPGAYAADEVLSPSAALLAVEVVSDSSVTTDRITKPAVYAAWGIEGFWRVETEPELSLTAYALEPGADVYTEVGTWRAGETVTLEHPFAVSFDLDALSR